MKIELVKYVHGFPLQIIGIRCKSAQLGCVVVHNDQLRARRCSGPVKIIWVYLVQRNSFGTAKWHDLLKPKKLFTFLFLIQPHTCNCFCRSESFQYLPEIRQPGLSYPDVCIHIRYLLLHGFDGVLQCLFNGLIGRV